MDNKRNKFTAYDYLIIIALSVIALILFGISKITIGFDDAYISYRYAENLVNGHGLVYNMGEKVFGSTTLLWVLLLGFVSTITKVPVEHASPFLNLLFLCLNVCLTYYLIRKEGGSIFLSVLGCLFLFISPHFLLISATGMETMFYIFLMLCTIAFYFGRRLFIAGILAGLVFATRPDGLILFVAIMILSVFSNTYLNKEIKLIKIFKEPLVVLAGFVLVAIPFTAFCYGYYGSILPNTFFAKRTHEMVAGRWWMLKHFIKGVGFPVLFCALVSSTVIFLSRKKIRGRLLSFDLKDHRLYILSAMWLLIYTAAWSWARIDLYQWYIAAMGPMCTFLAIYLILSGGEYIKLWQYKFAIYVIIGVISIYWGSKCYNDIFRFHMYARQIEYPRKSIGLAIKKYTQVEKEVLETGAIGIIGYYSNMFIVDGSKLITPIKKEKDYPKPTLYSVFDETWYKDSKIIYMRSGPFHNGPDSLLLAKSTSTWDPLRVKPDLWVDAYFGKNVQLIGINPIQTSIKPGEVIQFEILWRFHQPLPSDRKINYTIGNDKNPSLVVLETHGFYRNRRRYVDVSEGETILDSVNMIIPKDIKPGSYELSGFIYPTDGYELDMNLSSRTHPKQKYLTNIEIK